MKKNLAASFLLVVLNIQAQNLVPNGGFEDYTSLPDAGSQWMFALPWTIPENNTPITSTPDYLHMYGSGIAKLPFNYLGNIRPHSGNAIMHISTWGEWEPNLSEYISVKLKEPLLPEHTYEVSFYTSIGSNYIGGYTSNGLGAYLSASLPDQVGIDNIIATPQWEMDSILLDSIWYKMSFIIRPDEAYEYLTVGNFKDSSRIRTKLIYPPASFKYAGFYLDDISIIDLEKRALFVPNAISLNKNEMNDFLTINSSSAQSLLKIYNKLGEKVYEGSTDFKDHSHDFLFGVYVYSLYVKYNTGEEVFMKGNITLLK